MKRLDSLLGMGTDTHVNAGSAECAGDGSLTAVKELGAAVGMGAEEPASIVHSSSIRVEHYAATPLPVDSTAASAPSVMQAAGT